ncbi:MAG: MtnX-like HAD-IB family phosphatase [bacterium]|nr:MtnX-like HAD-IB family phosphatase [bacterium]
MEKIAILCDFDGTVSVDDVGNTLFQTFADPELSGPVIEDWKAGRISSRECLEREAELAHATRADLDEFAGRCQLDPYFKDFIDFTRKRGMEFVIVSDGLDHYIERMLVRNGLGDIDFFANVLHIIDDKLQVSFPYYDLRECQDCGNCKTHHLEQYKRQGYYIVYIGNGLSDRCPCHYSDLVFAKGELLDFCRIADIEHVPFTNFRDIEREMVQRFVLNGADGYPDAEAL